MLLEVSNAGTEEANGIYERTEETIRDAPVWRKRGGNAHIQFWDDNCGWELYHAGMQGCCTYWTKNSDHEESNMHPTKAEWSVRDGSSPAPSVKYYFEE
jgi:hypothetical protein